MKFLLFLAFTSFAVALPTPDEAARLMGSERAAERDQITLELWTSGPAALPLLKILASYDDPEIAHRAGFIFRRLKMGLGPDSPEDLLKLAASVEQTNPEDREEALVELIDHPLGVPVALTLLDLWSRETPRNDQSFQRWTKHVADALIEQRNFWPTFLTKSLTPRCRGALIANLSGQDMPMKDIMIEHLSLKDTRQVFEEARLISPFLTPVVYEGLARAAILANDPATALDILFEAAATSEDSRVLRQIAFLEKITGLPARPFNGLQSSELELLRARAAGEIEAVRESASRFPADSLLAYESRLLCGELPLPSIDLPADQLSRPLTAALRQSFASPPLEPDIEDLASTVTGDFHRLSRTLLLLGHPVEAAQILADRHEKEAAVRTLWMTGYQSEAIQIAEATMEDRESEERISMRLTLTQLLGGAQRLDDAREIFEPLFQDEIEIENLRREAVRVASLLYPREKVLKLVPELERENSYNRQMAIGALLPFPQKVSIFIYEKYVKSNPGLKPLEILEKVEAHLSKDRQFLIDHYQEILQGLGEKMVQSTNADYQLALFLKAPGAIQMVARSSWHRLSCSDLEAIIADDFWSLEERQEALKIALQIDPCNPILRQLDFQLNQEGDTKLIDQLTLGDPGEVSQLPFQGPHESLHLLAAELANLDQSFSLRAVHQTASAILEAGRPADAARFLQAAFIGELVLETQPGTSSAQFADSIRTYLIAREKTAATPEARTIWTARRKVWERVEE